MADAMNGIESDPANPQPGSPPFLPDALDDQARDYYLEQRRSYEGWIGDYMGDPRYLRSPRLLSIETYVKCNAVCSFCPYPTSDRIGQKLDMGIIRKIIDEVSEAETHPEVFLPTRITEPLLDKRMYEIVDYVGQKLPSTKLKHFTNGTTMNMTHIERIYALPNLGSINISFNSHDADEHRRLMGLNFEMVMKNIASMHRVYEARGLKFAVYLSRVGDGTNQDVEFVKWCQSNFPLFMAYSVPRFDWLGKVPALDAGRNPEGCTYWFQLNVLANGKEAFCGIDDDGKFGTGDTREQHALDIYNHPVRLALRQKKLRASHPACASCKACL